MNARTRVKERKRIFSAYADSLGHPHRRLAAHRGAHGTSGGQQRREIQQFRRVRLPRIQRCDRTTERRPHRLHPGQHLRHHSRHGHIAHNRRLQSGRHPRSILESRREHPPQFQRKTGHARLLLRHHLVVLRLDGTKRGDRFGSLRSRRPFRQRQRRHQRRHLRHHVGHRQ